MLLTKIQVLLSLVVLIIIHEPAAAWFFGRRRRRRSPPPCNPIDCQVSLWSDWLACSHRCGNSGTQMRTRSRTQMEQCGGICNYYFSEIQACNRDECQDGWPSDGYCACDVGYQGTCCENGEYSVIVYPF